jgi:ubiquinone biosynthesis protein COQ4
MIRFYKVVRMVGGGTIKLKTWQQAAVALGSAVGALLDPRRADLIAALGETTGKPAFERVLQRMKSSPEGRSVIVSPSLINYFRVLLFFQ